MSYKTFPITCLIALSLNCLLLRMNRFMKKQLEKIRPIEITEKQWWPMHTGN